jgi:protein FAM32A
VTELINRKKKKSKTKAHSEGGSELDKERDRAKKVILEEEHGKRSESPTPNVGSSGDRKTEAERRFEEVQRRRVRTSFNQSKEF